MLCLSRKLKETLVFGFPAQTVRVTISRIRADSVRLAIDAPPAVKVLREELLHEPPAVKPPRRYDPELMLAKLAGEVAWLRHMENQWDPPNASQRKAMAESRAKIDAMLACIFPPQPTRGTRHEQDPDPQEKAIEAEPRPAPLAGEAIAAEAPRL